MTVAYDQKAVAVIKFLDGFGKFNAEYLKQIDKEIKGNGRTGANIIEQHFEKSPSKGGNLPALEKSTIKRRKPEKKLVQEGDLKGASLKSRKPKVRGNKAIFSAKAPEYGKHLTDGIPSKKGKKVYNFFNIFKNELGLFNKMTQSVFDFLLLTKGVK